MQQLQQVATVHAARSLSLSFSYSQSIDEWIRQESEKTQKCSNWEKIDLCINGPVVVVVETEIQ